MHPSHFRRAFTLIELLVVIAIIAILAVVVVLVLNPAQLLAQSRDANRVSDMATLTNAAGLYTTDQTGAQGYTLGTPGTVYLSVPDPLATSTAGDACQGLGLPALPSGYVYHCAAPATFLATNGTGWLPMDFQAISSGGPFGTLPVDPVNQTSTGLYYTYTTNGTQFELTYIPESQKQRTALKDSPSVPGFPGVDAVGTNIALSPLYNPSSLAISWSLNEGTGTVVNDISGSGISGTLVNGPLWVPGVSGPYALQFNGTTQGVSTVNPFTFSSSTVTIALWVKGTGYFMGQQPCNSGWLLQITSGGVINMATHCGGAWYTGSLPMNTSVWNYVTVVSGPTSTQYYVNGVFDSTFAGTMFDNASYPPPSSTLVFGDASWDGYFAGSLDGFRTYNRALSPAEVTALYDSER